MEKARILLADDHELMLEGLQKLLDPEFQIVGSVTDGRAAITAFEQLRPDVVLLDVALPLLNGIEAARRIKEISPSALIVFVTMQMDRTYLEAAFRAGASGYVLKQAAVRDLLEAIRTVTSGGYYVSPLIAQKAGAPPFDATRTVAEVFGGRLTPRQREILQLIAEGKTMKEMADILHISVRTVEFHKNSIVEELGLRSTAELTRYALGHGIVST
jgi:DNA-binding NarL/FixJ family response regulator